jgi:hypothetical protein
VQINFIFKDNECILFLSYGCSCDNFVDLVLVLDREACVSTKQEICFRYKNYRQMTPLKTIIKDACFNYFQTIWQVLWNLLYCRIKTIYILPVLTIEIEIVRYTRIVLGIFPKKMGKEL